MMILILPTVFIPLRTHILPLVVSTESEICDRESLCKILGLIEGLYCKQCIHGITAAYRTQAA